MKYLVTALRECGLTVVPSDANFVMVPLQSEHEVNELYEELLKEGIIIRPLRSFGLPHCIRITVGTPDQNRRLIDSLHRIFERLGVNSESD
jgi:histidinol-phosphate aminotransferase